MNFNFQSVKYNQTILENFPNLNDEANIKIATSNKSDQVNFKNFLQKEISVLRMEIDAVIEENKRIANLPIDEQIESGYAIGCLKIESDTIDEYGGFIVNFVKSDGDIDNIYNLKVGEFVELLDCGFNILSTRENKFRNIKKENL